MNKLRISSIDVFRAITMFLMVFVNTLWTSNGIPAWLEHAPAQADAMGFSDIIFPAFLFIVGLSIPFAIESRASRGQSRSSIFRHILLRSLALIIMGFFHVNLENYSESSLLSKAAWEIIITVGFFLVWLDYKGETLNKWKLKLQGAGIIILVAMAFIYKGDSPAGTTWMTTQWWGILGLIGWAYLLSASIVLWSGGKARAAWISFFLFMVFNAASLAGWLHFFSPVTSYGILDLGNASNAALVMAGVCVINIYKKYEHRISKTATIYILLAVLLFVYGFATRPVWGISKIRATPSWIAICTGINILFFLLLIFITDLKKKEKWFNVIKPAGTSTLTCYLIPYILFPVFLSMLDLKMPAPLNTGLIGIVKCLLFALMVVLLTGWLEKRRIRLKI